ncbi:MAG: hypothetical protein ACTSWA_08175, partial [Candidatus Thorarchaeota archaeon]
MSEKTISQVDLSSWRKETLRASPNSQHVAYVVRRGEKQSMMVDGSEEKPFDNIDRDSILFSP